ncbi:MAG: type III pantothenate kinase [Armatimonadetes bacterium]|nr:type III pantothenate kinase [Armatimonadota bacterium]
MRLAINVGNTNTAFGLWQKGLWLGTGSVATHPLTTLSGRLLAILDLALEGRQVEAVGLASVVPDADLALPEGLSSITNGPFRQLSGTAPCGIQIRYKTPETLGADRIAGVLGALELGPGPWIVVDFGTATTINVFDGAFLGGAILPGARTAAEALLRDTAMLPDFDLELPPGAIGRSTAECLQVGTVLGHAHAVDGLVIAMSGELSAAPRVLATGGLAATFAPHCRTVEKVEPNLVPMGILRFLNRTIEDAR